MGYMPTHIEKLIKLADETADYIATLERDLKNTTALYNTIRKNRDAWCAKYALLKHEISNPKRPDSRETINADF